MGRTSTVWTGPDARWRRHIANGLLKAGQPSRVRESFRKAKPIGWTQVVEASEVTDGALTHGAGGGAEGLDQGVVGVGLTPAGLLQATKKHGRPVYPLEWVAQKARVRFSTLQHF